MKTITTTYQVGVNEHSIEHVVELTQTNGSHAVRKAKLVDVPKNIKPYARRSHCTSTRLFQAHKEAQDAYNGEQDSFIRSRPQFETAVAHAKNPYERIGQ